MTLTQDVEYGAVLASVARLRCGDSPRLNGIDESHARLLAESGSRLPAILVQRGSMRVIDGMHRLRAAQIQQQTHIMVRYLDAEDDNAAFLRSVAENIEHGLPLTLADRKAAASRIMEMNPEWSDRAVAKAAGLSGKTVAVIRHGNQNIANLGRRKGRDGKMRPVDSLAGRMFAGELLAKRPDASLRDIAAATGLSPATVHDVRDRIRRGEQPTTTTQRVVGDTVRSHRLPRPHARADASIGSETDSAAILNDLRKDPALRYTKVGRTLLHWLCSCPPVDQIEHLVAALPAHCLPVVARLTRNYANRWRGIADLAEKRARSETA